MVLKKLSNLLSKGGLQLLQKYIYFNGTSVISIDFLLIFAKSKRNYNEKSGYRWWLICCFKLPKRNNIQIVSRTVIRNLKINDTLWNLMKFGRAVGLKLFKMAFRYDVQYNWYCLHIIWDFDEIIHIGSRRLKKLTN